MRLKEKNYLKKLPPPLKKFSAQGAKKVDYGTLRTRTFGTADWSNDVADVQSLQIATVKTLNIGTPRPATIIVLNIKQFNFTRK